MYKHNISIRVPIIVQKGGMSWHICADITVSVTPAVIAENTVVKIKTNIMKERMKNMINTDFNKIIVSGIPVQRPEIKSTSQGVSVLNFTLMSQGARHREDFDITVWGELAEKTHGIIDGSRKLLVEGTLHRKRKNGENSGQMEVNACRIFAMEN